MVNDERDMVSGLDYRYFVDRFSGEDKFLIEGINFGETNLTSRTCENEGVGLEFALAHGRFRNVEWRNSINYVDRRIDAVSYSGRGFDFRSTSGSINFKSYHDEITIETALIYDLKFGPLHFYGGAGTNMGLSFDDRIWVDGNIFRSQEDISNSDNLIDWDNQNNGSSYVGLRSDSHRLFTQRVFVQGGAGFAFFNKIEAGVEWKRGVGYRTIGTGARSTKLESFQMRLTYRI